MKKININGHMKRALKEKGYNIKKTSNGNVIEGKQSYIQMVNGEKGVLILWDEHSKYCERIDSVWPDKMRIRIKIQEEGTLSNIYINV